MDVIAELSTVLAARRNADPDESYVASLYAKGLNKILEKVGEEANEVVLAAKDLSAGTDTPEHLTEEVADLWFHCMVLLSHQNIEPEAVLAVLAKRFGVGGHEEKASRG